MAHVYAHLFGVPCTGLRFFSVYGPWGRPDMAPFKFVHSILSGKPISVYGDGNQIRDWTFIDDVVEGVVRTLDHPATPGRQFIRMNLLKAFFGHFCKIAVKLSKFSIVLFGSLVSPV